MYSFTELSTPHRRAQLLIFFFFNDTATPEIYTLSLHDALPISHAFADDHQMPAAHTQRRQRRFEQCPADAVEQDRKSTRLNSSHQIISYAVFCLKKKKKKKQKRQQTRPSKIPDPTATNLTVHML